MPKINPFLFLPFLFSLPFVKVVVVVVGDASCPKGYSSKTA